MAKYSGARGKRFGTVSSSVKEMYPKSSENDALYQIVTDGTSSYPQKKEIPYNNWVMYVFRFFGSDDVCRDAMEKLDSENYRELTENLGVLSRYIRANEDDFLKICGDKRRYFDLYYGSRNIVNTLKKRKIPKKVEPQWTEKDEKKDKRKKDTLANIETKYGKR